MAKFQNDGTAFKKFLRENKSLVYMLPILVILIIAAIFINLSLNSDKEAAKVDSGASTSGANSQIDTTQPQVDVLPQIIRSEGTEIVEHEKDPFKTPMKLTGVVYSPSRSTAIIEWGGYSYIVEQNDIVGDSKWKVTRIENDSISLDNGSESIVLALTLTEKGNKK
ncbi:MAG: hypothetical protein GX236_03330 [Clostridiaceae bacterium]|jgi:type II secretory pathway component PulC|nr:hypothetical protein [Clostridiaceae bacterium]